MTSANERKEHGVAAAIVASGILLAYWPVITGLVDAWSNDDNYSHGFFIVPLAAFFAWERRHAFMKAPTRPSMLGLGLVAGSLLMLVGGMLGAEFFLSRVSLVGVIAGALLFLYGWPRVRVMLFPIAFLLLMIPLPAIIFNQIAFPLQLLASHMGEFTIDRLEIPILREGNVLILANHTLEVAEACSGIRSLVSLFTLGIVFGYFSDDRPWMRAVIALSAIPLAIVTNGLRVASAGWAAHHYGAAGLEGVFHDFSGWLVFIVAFLMMLVLQKVLVYLAPPRITPRMVPA